MADITKKDILDVIESYLRTAESHINIAHDLAHDKLGEEKLAKELEYLRLNSFDCRRLIEKDYRNIYR